MAIERSEAVAAAAKANEVATPAAVAATTRSDAKVRMADSPK
jgi:hypothetical protein